MAYGHDPCYHYINHVYCCLLHLTSMTQYLRGDKAGYREIDKDAGLQILITSSKSVREKYRLLTRFACELSIFLCKDLTTVRN